MNELAVALLKRMREIDKDITKSLYNPEQENGSNDRPPEGDDYNLLWDAILDEIRAYCPNADAVIQEQLP